MSEPRYTLNEARLELAKEECRRRGHVFNVLISSSGDPERITCDRCGRSWPAGTPPTNKQADAAS